MDFSKIMVAGLTFFLVIYYGSYFIRLGWGQAENKTKKVCDMCFRDIKKINEFVKKNETPK